MHKEDFKYLQIILTDAALTQVCFETQLIAS